MKDRHTWQLSRRFFDIHVGGCNHEYFVDFLKFDLSLDNLWGYVNCKSLPYAVIQLYILS